MVNNLDLKFSFKPDYAVAPGETLREILGERGYSQADLAARTGLTEKTISLIVKGESPVTFETAAKLELALGMPASFWNKREADFQEQRISKRECVNYIDNKEWLKELPVKQLIDRGVIANISDKAMLVRELLAFYGFSSVESWRKSALAAESRFRGPAKAIDEKAGYVEAWLRLGELNAMQVNTETFCEKTLINSLAYARSLTTCNFHDAVSELTKVWAEAGVAFVLIPEIKNASISGATRWISKDKAILQASLKYRSDDHFWFSVFHEVAHILKHGRRKVFLENGWNTESEEELEANRFAADLLIPPSHAGEFQSLRSKASIRGFARRIGVSPGIVVGRLQHDKYLLPEHCNDLKRKLQYEK